MRKKKPLPLSLPASFFLGVIEGVTAPIRMEYGVPSSPCFFLYLFSAFSLCFCHWLSIAFLRDGSDATLKSVEDREFSRNWNFLQYSLGWPDSASSHTARCKEVIRIKEGNGAVCR